MLIIPSKYDSNTPRFVALHQIIKCNFSTQYLVGAEIGVFYGETANYLLHQNPYLYLYLIDNYKPYKSIHNEYDEDAQTAIRDIAIHALENHERENRIKWIFEDSSIAANQIDNSSLDFVFIDAAHDSQSVFTDCTAWYPKIRLGGILCGHDYCYTPVQLGVRLFNPKNQVHVIECEGDIWATEVI